MPRSIVHIGTHKTGTTSIQQFLSDNRAHCAERRIAYYEGRHLRGNHVELHVAAMRDDRLSPYKIQTGLTVDERYREVVRAEVAEFRKEATGTAVFSAEGLSFLRYADEVAWLKACLPSGTEVVVYLRNKDDYRKSHEAELASKPHTRDYLDPDSVFYLGPDSYLLDYHARLAPWRAVFGHENIHVFDYDEETRKAGSVLPSFLRFIGLEETAGSEMWRGLFLNTRKRPLLPDIR
jgi:hypothetical protein